MSALPRTRNSALEATRSNRLKTAGKDNFGAIDHRFLADMRSSIDG
jgi:hypothetical protein